MFDKNLLLKTEILSKPFGAQFLSLLLFESKGLD